MIFNPYLKLASIIGDIRLRRGTETRWYCSSSMKEIIIKSTIKIKQILITLCGIFKPFKL